jgi:peptide/nickel transport system ATP-binding protein
MTTATAGPAGPLLAVRDLAVTYRTRRGDRVAAVRHVDLDVAPGEVVALVGESGSGKTSVGRAVLGLHRAGTTVTGSIRLDGRELVGLPERRRGEVYGTRVTQVPQDPLASLNPLHAVGRQVAEVLRAHGLARGSAARDLALDALRLAGLDDAERLADRLPHELSGGQRQRVLIAQAIVAGPRLLVADEPTSALDVTVQRRILDHLDHLVRRSGTSLLLVTHDLGVAADRADRIVVLSDGAVVEEGPARRVLAAPERPYTRALVEAVPRASSPPLVRPPAADAPALLTATGLRHTFPARGGHPATVAVDGVDLRLPVGGALGLVGESGSGKTTTARVLLGLTRPDAGTVVLHPRDGAGPDADPGDREFRRRVQPVFQDPYASLDPAHPVGWSVLEPLRAQRGAHRVGRAARRARLAEVLDAVRLPRSAADRRPHELSGGQLQRVAIARALSIRPDLLVCDEPVSSLDVTVQAQVLELLATLHRETGLAYLFVSHDLAVVRQVCAEVAVMRDGRVVEQGPAGDVLDRPQHPYTAELVAAVPGRAVPAAG